MNLSRSLTAAVATTATSAVLAGMAFVGAGSASADVSFEDYCAGQSAPVLPSHTPNAAPQATHDTAHAIAGGEIEIKVLANDTDPDGDALAVVNTSEPKHGDVCVNGDGSLEYGAASSSKGYTETFTYGITDGDFYRTSSVTVTVQGVKSMRARLLHRLVYKRHSHRVKQRAAIGFTNPNSRAMYVLAGDPERDEPQIARGLGVGKSMRFLTRTRTIAYIVGVSTGNGEIALVNVGQLDTHTGIQQVDSMDESGFGRARASWASPSRARALMRAAARG